MASKYIQIPNRALTAQIIRSAGEKREVHRIGMVACFIGEVEQDQLLGAENRLQGMELAPMGDIPEGKKVIILIWRSFIVRLICLRGRRYTRSIKRPLEFPSEMGPPTKCIYDGENESNWGAFGVVTGNI
jgi:hypothetical protein